MNARLLPSLALGCLGLASVACGGAPTADQRSISDPVPNVSLTERQDAIVDVEEVPPAEVGKSDRISDPVDSKPLSEVDPAPLDEAPPPRTARAADDDDPPAAPPVPTPAAAPCADEDDTCRIERLGEVRLGWLKEGLTREDVVERLGPPARSEGPMEEGATGEWVTFAAWPSAGISIDFSANTKDGAQAARGITVVAPFDGKTDRGVGIGSTRAEVMAAYGSVLDPRVDGIVAGSVYGGVFFDFDGQGRVSRIFVGPGAE